MCVALRTDAAGLGALKTRQVRCHNGPATCLSNPPYGDGFNRDVVATAFPDPVRNSAQTRTGGQPLKLLIRAKPYNATIAAPNNPMDVSWRAMTMWFGTLVVTQLKNSVNCVAGSVLDRSSMTMAGGQRHAL